MNKQFTNEINRIKEQLIAEKPLALQRVIQHGLWDFNGIEHSGVREQLPLYSNNNKQELAFCLAVAETYLANCFEEGKRINSSTDAAEFLSLKLRDKEQEVFAVLLLDTQMRVIHYEEMFQGTINAAAVYPREVVKLALKYNATSVILAHNHPSGVAEPSSSDEAITSKIKRALSTVDIAVLDHLVIGHGRPISFESRGLL